MGRPLAGTIAERYLINRGLSDVAHHKALRFHPDCYYWREGHSPLEQPETWPALLAQVTDLNGRQTGLQRTWFDSATAQKAPVEPCRKAMGCLLGNGVWLGNPDDVTAAGEGLETMLSLRIALPALPAVAALSANHLSALRLPETTRRLYVAVDNDPAGRSAAKALAERAMNKSIEVVRLVPRLGDFNDDLRAFGLNELRVHLRPQLAPGDAGLALPD